MVNPIISLHLLKIKRPSKGRFIFSEVLIGSNRRRRIYSSNLGMFILKWLQLCIV